MSSHLSGPNSINSMHTAKPQRQRARVRGQDASQAAHEEIGRCSGVGTGEDLLKAVLRLHLGAERSGAELDRELLLLLGLRVPIVESIPVSKSHASALTLIRARANKCAVVVLLKSA